MIFLFPTHIEARLFIERSPNSIVEIVGVGMAACGAAVAMLSRKYPGDMMILAGIAGTYDEDEIAVCDVVEVVEESIEELPEMYQTRYRNSAHFTDLYSVVSNSVNCSGHIPEAAQIENMEGAALFATCEALRVECAQIRAISNRVGVPFIEWKIDEALEALTQKLLDIAACL